MCYRNLLPFQRWHFPLWPCFEMISPSQQSRNLELPRQWRTLVGSLQRAGGSVRLQQPSLARQGWRWGETRGSDRGLDQALECFARRGATGHYPNRVTDWAIALCWDWKGEGCQLAWVTGSSWITYLLLRKDCQHFMLEHRSSPPAWAVQMLKRRKKILLQPSRTCLKVCYTVHLDTSQLTN